MEAVGKSSVDVVVALPFCCDQEGQGAIWRQYIHAAVLFSVSGQQSNAALFHIQVGSHRVERLQMEMLKRWDESEGKMKWNWREHLKDGRREEWWDTAEESEMLGGGGGGGKRSEPDTNREVWDIENAKNPIMLIERIFNSENVDKLL